MTAYWLNKLVRDKSSENMRVAGAVVVSRVLSQDEFLKEIAEKLKEEADEFCAAETPAEQEEELADILELIDAYLQARRVSLEDIRRIQSTKRERRGGFAAREFVEYIEAPKGSTYDIYCAAAPAKYRVKND